MPDVLERGPSDDEGSSRLYRPPGWVMGLVVVAAAVGAVLVAREPASEVAAEPAPSPTAAARERPQAIWASRAGACGSRAPLSRIALPPLRSRTGLQVLVGGSGLRLVDVDSGVVRPVTGLAGAAARPVEQLARAGASYLALTRSCTSFRPSGSVFEVAPGSLGAREAADGRVDRLLQGERHAWAVTYPEDPADPVALRPLGGAPAVQLPPRFIPLVHTSAGLVGPVAPGGRAVPGPAVSADGLPRLALLPHVGAGERAPALQDLGRRATLLAGDAGSVVSTARCSPARRCLVTRTPLGAGGSHEVALPAGRLPSLPTVLSADGRLLALQLRRAGSEDAEGSADSVASSELAVLDLVTGRLRLLQGLEIAPGTTVGLTWAARERRLVVALPEGDRTRLLVWWPLLEHAAVSPARLPGLLLGSAPVLDVTADAMAGHPALRATVPASAARWARRATSESSTSGPPTRPATTTRSP